MSPCVLAHHFTRENTFSCGFSAVIPGDQCSFALATVCPTLYIFSYLLSIWEDCTVM